jgi:hypothetical protein
MGILNVTLLGLFVLARLVLLVKTVQLLPVAISGKPAVGVGLGRYTRRKFPEFRNETR